MHDIFSPYFLRARIFFWYLPNPPLKYLMVRPLRPPVSDFVRRSQQTNLISIDCSPHISANCHNNSLKFCLVSSCSVRNKTGDIADYIAHDCKPDSLAITSLGWAGMMMRYELSYVLKVTKRMIMCVACVAVEELPCCIEIFLM